MGTRLIVVSTLLATLAVVTLFVCSEVHSEPIQLSTVMTKLQAIHEDTKNLLMKNSELKPTIQNGVKLQQANQQHNKHSSRTSTHATATTTGDQSQKGSQPAPGLTVSSAPKPAVGTRGKGLIDYMELEEFNEWVDMNLEYAVKNTRASIEALKEEAQQNNGTVEYSEQAVQDGIEGVRYWQSAVIFQDKTLKNEKFEVEE